MPSQDKSPLEGWREATGWVYNLCHQTIYIVSRTYVYTVAATLRVLLPRGDLPMA